MDYFDFPKLDQEEKLRNVIKKDVLFLESLKDLGTVSQTIRLDYNAVVFCRRGRIQLELGMLSLKGEDGSAKTETRKKGTSLRNRQKVIVGEKQFLLVPVNKTIPPMMVSTDIDASVLLVSDRMLKLVLGSQINVWNKAMYIDELFVLEGGPWIASIQEFSQTVYAGRNLAFHDEIVMSFLRMLMLLLCEEMMRQTNQASTNSLSTEHEKSVFSSFLTLLSAEPQKRQPVSYYAEKLNITSKYLSTICRRVSDKSPIRWISESVMEECYNLLLNTDLSVKEISNRMGFPNSSFFGQYFRKQANMTPVEYRTKYS